METAPRLEQQHAADHLWLLEKAIAALRRNMMVTCDDADHELVKQLVRIRCPTRHIPNTYPTQLNNN